MKAEIYLGIDIGTTNTKVVSITRGGEIAKEESFPTPKYERDGVEFIDLERLERFFDHTISNTHRDREVLGVSFSSIGESVVPVAGREKLYDPIIWYDEVTRQVKSEVDEVIGQYGAYQRSGLKDSYTYSLYKAAWMEEHLSFRSPEYWLPLASYFPYRYTGNTSWEVTQSCRSLLFDVTNREWIEGVQQEYELEGRLGEISYIGEFLGHTTEDIPLFLSGHDHLTGLYALLKIIEEEEVIYDSMGSASLIATLIEEEEFAPGEYLKTPNDIIGAAFQEDQYYYENSIKYYGKLFESVSSLMGLGEDELEKIHGEILEDYEGLRVMNFSTGGDFYAPETKNRVNLLNLPINQRKKEVIHSLYLYLTHMNERIFEKLDAKLDGDPVYLVFGGVSSNDLLMKYKAAVLGKTMRKVNLEELTAVGAAISAMIGAGDFSALARLKKNQDVEVITPGKLDPHYFQEKSAELRDFYEGLGDSGFYDNTD